MFNRHGKPTSKKTKSQNPLTAIETPAKLLSSAKRPELMSNIHESITLDTARYEHLCLSLIHNFANHCQNLPETAQYYGGGILDFNLNRTDVALHLFRQYLTQGQDDPLSEEQKLWLYALFSAALLQGVGKLHIDYQVGLFDKNGQFLKTWQPLLEAPSMIGQYYDYQFTHNSDETIRPRLNLLLARQLMPISGFNWILSNPKVLAIWLALLNEDEDGSGTLGAILNRAKSLTIQRYLLSLPARQHGGSSGGGEVIPRTSRVGTFIDNHPPSTASENERALGLEFFRWLMDAIASGKILIDQVPLLMVVSGGLLLSLKVFELFIKDHPAYKNWQRVQQGFVSLGLNQIGADGNLISRHNHKQEILSGILVDSAILPDHVKVFDPTTQQVKTMSALELMNQTKASQLQQQQNLDKTAPLAQLSENGTWVAPNDKAVIFQTGMTRRV